MSNALTPYEALRKAVERAGSQSAFARICGVTQPSVWKWLQSGKRLPAEHVLCVEAATGLSRHSLRPDIYPRDPIPFASPAVAADPVALCGPILSAAAPARHGNPPHPLDEKDAA